MDLNQVEAVSGAALENEEAKQRYLNGEITAAEQQVYDAMTVGEFLGRVRAMNMIEEISTVSGTVWMRQIKESGFYKSLPGKPNWEDFCRDYLKSSRSFVDERVGNLKRYGEKFLATMQEMGMGYREMRLLNKSVKAGDVEVSEERIRIGEEEIPFTPEHREDLEAALGSILMDHATALSKEKKATEAAKKALTRYQTNTDNIVKEELKGILSEKDELLAENERLKRLAPDPGASPEEVDKYWGAVIDELSACSRQFNLICRRLYKMPKSVMMSRTENGTLFGAIDAVEIMMSDLRGELEDKLER